jgi:hypothetical protein
MEERKRRASVKFGCKKMDAVWVCALLQKAAS